MRLVTFVEGDKAARPGLVVGEGIVDLGVQGFKDTIAFMSAPESVQAEAVRARPTIALEQVKLLAPVPIPPRIFGIGVNYADHAAESGTKMRDVPTVFMVLSSAVVGPGADVVLPRNSLMVDYEAELAVVIGKAGHRIAASQWEEHVFGYTMMNDVSARDVQRATSQWSLGKSFPTFAPMGPWVVSKDEIADPHRLGISMTIGGERLQDANTSQMIYKIPALVEYLSSIVPLQVGDVISTGTPAGVGMGRTPQRWLKAGEEMVVAIEGIGELRNPVVGE
ncbi:MAG TPA: fumarylacetoacetate hydrolase family protein [Acidobacteriaceae bacterium]|jgi:2-keto-4-pentenoate hydratase/2-oxohepta-3-ene-1,7-dioic acid hydratase in catechol pathway|nr:fumarylacetoacetate hydrolase family protein [Acidobacteriaceae bacterium]